MVNMKKTVFIYILAFFALAACSKKTEGPKLGKNPPDNGGGNTEEEWLSPLKVMTYNIEYTSVVNAETNPWGSRKELVKEIFDKYRPDIVGVQELSKAQLEDMVALMPQYAFVGT